MPPSADWPAPTEVVSAMSDSNSKLRVRELRKVYGPVTALKGASLTLREGEFLTLLGPSGSGKTTLLMSVAGLIEPDAGEIWIDGKLITHTPSFQRDIGMVFQNYALFPHMTVFENIAFPLQMRRRRETDVERAVIDALEVVQLSGFGPRYPRELSGGQQQRVALARCFVYRPSIILMDEPLGALDKNLREQMQLEIKQLHTRLGITVLYVTHDQEEALTLSDTICLMNGGAIEQMGAPAELYFRPVNTFVAGFLGSPNILSGSVAELGPTARINLDGATISVPPQPGITVGQTIKLMIRPEAITLLGPQESAENMLHGSVKDVIMMGAVTRYLVAAATGDIISTTRLTREAAEKLQPGTPVTLGWLIGDTVMLPGQESPAS
jgi:putative spermidine/putrescine transport system ATP-binding protein